MHTISPSRYVGRSTVSRIWYQCSPQTYDCHPHFTACVYKTSEPLHVHVHVSQSMVVLCMLKQVFTFIFKFCLYVIPICPLFTCTCTYTEDIPFPTRMKPCRLYREGNNFSFLLVVILTLYLYTCIWTTRTSVSKENPTTKNDNFIPFLPLPSTGGSTHYCITSERSSAKEDGPDANQGCSSEKIRRGRRWRGRGR